MIFPKLQYVREISISNLILFSFVKLDFLILLEKYSKASLYLPLLYKLFPLENKELFCVYERVEKERNNNITKHLNIVLFTIYMMMNLM